MATDTIGVADKLKALEDERTKALLRLEKADEQLGLAYGKMALLIEPDLLIRVCEHDRMVRISHTYGYMVTTTAAQALEVGQWIQDNADMLRAMADAEGAGE